MTLSNLNAYGTGFQIKVLSSLLTHKEFLLNILGPTDNIILFKYTRILNQETGPIIIGIETITKEDT